MSVSHRDHPDIFPEAGMYAHVPPHQHTSFRESKIACPYCDRPLLVGGFVGQRRLARVERQGDWCECAVTLIPDSHEVLFCSDGCPGQFVVPKDAL